MPDTERDLALDLLVTSARLTRFVGQASGATERTATWRSLAILEEHGPLRLTAFARVDRLAQPTATANLGRLVAAGLVERRPDPLDGRAHLFALTDAGRVRLEQLRARATDLLAPRLPRLDAGQRRALAEATEAIRLLLEEDPEPRTRDDPREDGHR